MVFSTESPPFIYKFDEGFALFHCYRSYYDPSLNTSIHYVRSRSLLISGL